MNRDNDLENIQFLTSKQISKYLCIPLRTIQRLTKDGKLKGIKIGKQWRYKKSDIEGYISFGTDFSKTHARKYHEFTERRAYPRINSNLICQYAVNLPPFRITEGKGIVKDLSAGGVLLINQSNQFKKMRVNDPIDLDFNLISKDEAANIKIEARIVRKNNNELGIKFRNISNNDRIRIIQYIG